MGQYDKVSSPFGGPGRYTNPGMIALVKTYCAIKGISLSQFYCIQGSFNTTVAASAGTHDKADCIDVSSSVDDDLMKKIGAFAWQRTSAQGFTPHVHMGRMYSTAMAWLATAQDKAYRDNRSNGLGNLSTKDTSWCPRYRGVKHISGPTTKKYVATKETWGYSQAGCHSSNDADLKVKTRAKGYVLYNIAGRVQSNGSDYFVTNGGTFYNVANFTAYVEPTTSTPAPSTSTSTAYYVRGPFAIGHESTRSGSPRAGQVKQWGELINISKIVTNAGATWGYTTYSGVGCYYRMANLTTTKPTTPVVKKGTITVGEYNVAAQASGHASTYPTRAPLSAKHMVESGADVFLTCEYGSSGKYHANGKSYLQISDDARKAASAGNLVRVPHGEKWRYILRREDTTDYVADSGKTITLATKVDTDGCQVAMSIIKKNGIDHLFAVYHFDVGATTAQKKAQAVDTVKAVEAYRKEKSIAPWNVIIGGDGNDSTGAVELVFGAWGFNPLAEAPGAVHASSRTTNHWNNYWTTGPRLDDIYVFDGSAESWQTLLDAVASDHNPQWGTVTSYGI